MDWLFCPKTGVGFKGLVWICVCINVIHCTYLKPYVLKRLILGLVQHKSTSNKIYIVTLFLQVMVLVFLIIKSFSTSVLYIFIKLQKNKACSASSFLFLLFFLHFMNIIINSLHLGPLKNIQRYKGRKWQRVKCSFTSGMYQRIQPSCPQLDIRSTKQTPTANPWWCTLKPRYILRNDDCEVGAGAGVAEGTLMSRFTTMAEIGMMLVCSIYQYYQCHMCH